MKKILTIIILNLLDLNYLIIGIIFGVRSYLKITECDIKATYLGFLFMLFFVVLHFTKQINNLKKE